MPHFVASDLGLQCLSLSHKKDTRLIWVKAIKKKIRIVFITYVVHIMQID